MGRIKGVFMNFYNENATSFPFGTRALFGERKMALRPVGRPRLSIPDETTGAPLFSVVLKGGTRGGIILIFD
jgi:hypothetical protein